jgi:transcriptional regulator NrdR family protein
MVCIYCRGDTQVTNSRLQKKANSVWRRRRCLKCGAMFSSVEQSRYEQSFMVAQDQSHLVAFERDRLFLDMYEACRHRKTALRDAAALTDTILGKLLAEYTSTGTIERRDIVAVANGVLQHFDAAAHVHYGAFHPL